MKRSHSLPLRLGKSLQGAVAAIIGFVVVLFMRMLRLIDRARLAGFLAAAARVVGPWLPEQKVGRANLAAAFPERTAAQREEILSGVWDNLGRVAGEFLHIDRLHIFDPERPGPEDIVYEQETFDRFHALRLDGKPALIFAAHLANWELPALVAAVYKLDTHVLYRPLNNRVVDKEVRRLRAGCMGTLIPTTLDAPVRLMRTLKAGGHVAILVDQFFDKGVDVTFFGRPCKANPLVAQLARNIECPIHGTRVVRLPGGNTFRVDLTERIAPALDADGKIDIRGTMQVITSVIEGWVREHPEQWLWLHRRWR